MTELIARDAVDAVLPAIGDMTARNWDFDLTPYHPLIIGAFCVVGPSAVLGVILGLQLLEDKDQRTLAALRVTPLPRAAYPTYRAVVMVVVTTASMVAALAITRLVPGGVLVRSIPIGVVTGLLTVSLGLLMSAIAGNKVEGLAVARVLGIAVFTLPMIPFFLQDNSWELAFGVLPPYWPVRAFWVAWEGGDFWPYVLGGLVVNGAVAFLLLRLVARRLG